MTLNVLQRDSQTHWRVLGDGPVGAVALHCSLAHSGSWSGLSRALPGLCITAPDLPAHGRSADWDGVSDLHSDATRIAKDHLERSGPAHLMGHSFGAVVALRLAIESPELVRSLILFEPVLFAAARSAGSPEFAAHIARTAPVEKATMAGDKHKAARIFHGIWGVGERFEDMAEARQAYIADRIHLIKAQNGTLVDDAAGLLGFTRLESVAAPALLIEGARSPGVIDAINTELVRRLRHVRRAKVEGAGHMLPISHPVECARLVDAFLSDYGEQRLI